jgi:cytochrome P450
MCSAVLHIISSAPVYNTLLADIQGAEKAGTISQPIQFQEAQKLPYLQACLKESIRIYSNVGVPLPRVVPAGGAEMCGYFLPEGTWVGMAPWAVGRRREVFGEDVEVYRPERWIEAGEEGRREMEKADVTFGAGYCSCLGKNLALLEIYKGIVEVCSLDFLYLFPFSILGALTFPRSC